MGSVNQRKNQYYIYIICYVFGFGTGSWDFFIDFSNCKPLRHRKAIPFQTIGLYIDANQIECVSCRMQNTPKSVGSRATSTTGKTWEVSVLYQYIPLIRVMIKPFRWCIIKSLNRYIDNLSIQVRCSKQSQKALTQMPNTYMHICFTEQSPVNCPIDLALSERRHPA